MIFHWLALVSLGPNWCFRFNPKWPQKDFDSAPSLAWTKPCQSAASVGVNAILEAQFVQVIAQGFHSCVQGTKGCVSCVRQLALSIPNLRYLVYLVDLFTFIYLFIIYLYTLYSCNKGWLGNPYSQNLPVPCPVKAWRKGSFILFQLARILSMAPGSATAAFLLVVDPPLWKIWKSVGIFIPNIWKNKENVPNHQPDVLFLNGLMIKRFK